MRTSKGWMRGLAMGGLLLASAALAAKGPRPAHSWELDMTSREYQALIEQRGGIQAYRAKDSDLAHILDLGKRNIDWVSAINAQRPPEQQLQLSTPETTRAFPIETPNLSSPTIIKGNLTALRDRLPAVMQKVLFDSPDQAVPSTTVGVDDATFIGLSRELDYVYQAASRWLLEEPDLEEYQSLSYLDIRGYYYLNREPKLAEALAAWTSLPDTEKTRLGDWLVGLCHNSQLGKDDCRAALQAASAEAGGVKAYYDKYLPDGKAVWDQFFVISNPRPEARWTAADPQHFFLPFARPERQDIEKWLADNIEDEWRWGDWSLHLAFTDEPGSWVHVAFEAGTTPHVNDLGGDTITMDENRPLEEYSVRWTIRHEFGHVLGFPDCYIEFYDADQQVMVNYQIDVTNLMCSRRGHLQPEHVEQLRRFYYKDAAAAAH